MNARLRSAGPLIVVGAAAALVRLAVLAAHPVLAPMDSYARLVEPTIVLKSSWLPLYQLTLAALSVVTSTPIAFQLWTAILGAVSAVAVAGLARSLGGETAGWAAGAVVACAPAFVLPSVGLYQEPLAIGLLAAGAWALAERRLGWASVAWTLAVLTRYEAWGLVGIGAVAILADRRWAVGARIAAVAGPVGAVLGWTAVSSGRLGSFDPGFGPGRWMGRAETLTALASASGLQVVALVALIGAPVLWWTREVPRAWVAALAGAGVGTVIAYAILDPFGSPENPRQLVVPGTVAAVLAAVALGRAARRVPFAVRVPGAIAAIGWLAALPAATLLVAGPAVPSDVELAAAVGRHLPADTDVLVLAPGFPRWPDAPDAVCLAAKVYGAHARVRCAADAPDAEAPPDDTDIVVRIGRFVPWRPVRLDGSWHPAVDEDALAVWSRAAEVDAPTLAAIARRHPPGPACTAWLPVDVDLEAIALEGPLTRYEEHRIAFYANGHAWFTAAASGRLVVTACGTPALGEAAELTVSAGDIMGRHRTTSTYTDIAGPRVSTGDRVELGFANDRATDAEDRNLFIGRIRIDPEPPPAN